MKVSVWELNPSGGSGSRRAGAAPSASLMKIYEAISPLLMRSHVERRRDTFREPATTSGLVDAHRRVFHSLAKRDPDSAEAGLRDHFAIGDDLRRRNLISAYQPRRKRS